MWQHWQTCSVSALLSFSPTKSYNSPVFAGCVPTDRHILLLEDAWILLNIFYYSFCIVGKRKYTYTWIVKSQYRERKKTCQASSLCPSSFLLSPSIQPCCDISRLGESSWLKWLFIVPLGGKSSWTPCGPLIWANRRVSHQPVGPRVAEHRGELSHSNSVWLLRPRLHRQTGWWDCRGRPDSRFALPPAAALPHLLVALFSVSLTAVPGCDTRKRGGGSGCSLAVGPLGFVQESFRWAR